MSEEHIIADAWVLRDPGPNDVVFLRVDEPVAPDALQRMSAEINRQLPCRVVLMHGMKLDWPTGFVL